MSHDLIAWAISPAILSARKARGYPAVALEWHAEAVARRLRMDGPPPAAKASQKPSETAAATVAPMPVEAATRACQRRADLVKRAVLRVWQDEVAYDELSGLDKSPRVTQARWAAMWVHQEIFAQDSGNQISKSYARDHSTMVYAMKQVLKLRERDRWFDARVEAALRAAREEWETSRAKPASKPGPADRPSDAPPRQGPALERLDPCQEREATPPALSGS